MRGVRHPAAAETARLKAELQAQSLERRNSMSDQVAYRIEERLACDVLVIGSGMAGLCAAIQAGRSGCDTILIEKDPLLGGNASPLLGVHISGAHSFHPYASETGIIGEIEEEAAWLRAKIHTHGFHYNIAQQWDSLLKRLCEEAGVRVLRRHLGKLPVMGGTRIEAVVVEDVATFKTKRVEVAVAVIEASGDGHVAAEAGASFRMGREAKSEYGERSAPEVTDDITMGTSITALVRKAREPVEFIPPPGTPPFEPGYGFAGTKAMTDCLYKHSSWHPDGEFCFLWHTETGGQRHTIDDDHEIYEETLHQLYSAWNHIKNEAHIEEARNWELIWVSPKAGKRESRRFLGDYLLTQQDVEEARHFEDAIGYGGYAVDLHDPTGERVTQVDIVFHSIPPLWSLPYRCLYSKDLDNLFLAGRLVSVTHLALGTVRLMKTLATGGQAVGLAAGLCKRYGCSPRDVYAQHCAELQQQLLKRDATILTAPNGDETDLARSARVTASTEVRHGRTVADDWLAVDCVRGNVLWDWAPRLDRVSALVMNRADSPATLRMKLSRYEAAAKWQPDHLPHRFRYVKVANRAEWGADHTVAKFAPVADSAVEVPANFAGWVDFPLEIELAPKDPTSDDDRYCLTLLSHPQVFWARQQGYCDYARRCWLTTDAVEYEIDCDAHCFQLSPHPAFGEAANVINGWNRRFATNPVNAWIARPGFPQALTLSWDEPKSFNTVHLVFDTLTRAYQEMPFNCDQRVSPMCARDYELEVRVGDEWRPVAAAADNYRRRRIHAFERVTADALRLTVKSVWHDAHPARVYEVRVYDE